MRQFRADAGAWLLDVVRIAAALLLSGTVVVWLYVQLYDPMEIPADGITGELMKDGHVRFYLTGEKFHDNCPGEWKLIVEQPGGFWRSSQPKETGDLLPGKMNAIPIDAYFHEPLPPGDYTARLLLQYHCLVVFRHQLSFEIGPVLENDSYYAPALRQPLRYGMSRQQRSLR